MTVTKADVIAEQFRILHIALDCWREWSIEPVEETEHRKAKDALEKLEALLKDEAA